MSEKSHTNPATDERLEVSLLHSVYSHTWGNFLFEVYNVLQLREVLK